MKKIILIIFLIGLGVVLFCKGIFASDILDEVNTSFTYKGKPLHPFIIEDFYKGAVKSDIIVVDFIEALSSGLEVESRGDGWYRSERRIPDTTGMFPDEYLALHYKWIGRLKNGIHVLETGSDGGGSGFFMDLMFFRFSYDIFQYDGKKSKKILMKLVGWHNLGDRYEGEIKIKGNNIIIPASESQSGGGSIDKDIELDFEDIGI